MSGEEMACAALICAWAGWQLWKVGLWAVAWRENNAKRRRAA